jgi:hypothetical protein
MKDNKKIDDLIDDLISLLAYSSCRIVISDCNFSALICLQKVRKNNWLNS